jgi:hypothetical protein
MGLKSKKIEGADRAAFRATCELMRWPIPHEVLYFKRPASFLDPRPVLEFRHAAIT